MLYVMLTGRIHLTKLRNVGYETDKLQSIVLFIGFYFGNKKQKIENTNNNVEIQSIQAINVFRFTLLFDNNKMFATLVYFSLLTRKKISVC